jgi:parvulin-like peptidyl-prolyl isomerase
MNLAFKPISHVISVALLGTMMSDAISQDAPAPPIATVAPATDSPPVAVMIDGEPIFVAEIDDKLAQLKTKSGRMPGGDLDLVRASVLTQLVEKRLAVNQLTRDETLFKPGEVDAQMKVIDSNIKKQSGKSLDELMRQKGVTSDTIRHDVKWRIASERYIDRHLADALEGYFNEHRQEFDGSQLRASQILLRADRFDEKAAQTEARAAKIRDEIVAGKLDFASAARSYSVAPSREQGGDLGFLPRQGAMAEPFSAALFKLKKGEVSPPITTPFGTHLITVTDVKPGSRQWTEMIPQLRPLVAMKLLIDMAEKERATAKVEFTGNAPYIKPGTEELVRAGKKSP